jgi:hypothetical protein
MDNFIGKWKIVLAVLKALLMASIAIIALGIFHYKSHSPASQQIQVIINFGVFFLIPYWVLPLTLKLVMIINSSLKPENPVNPGRTVRKEIMVFLIFPAIAGTVIILGTKTSLLDRSVVLGNIGAFLFYFSEFGYILLLSLRGIKSLLLRKSVWLKILGIILALLLIICLFGLLA